MSELYKFSKKMVLFLVVLVILILIVQISYNRFVLENTQVYRKELEYQKYFNSSQNKNLEFAFFGSSHTRNAVNPSYINNSFNFGSSSENYVKTYYKLKRVLADGICIDTAVFELDLQTFSTVMTDKTNLFNELYIYSKFTPYKDIAEITNSSIFSIYIKSKFPFLGNGEDILIRILNPKKTEIYKGWTNDSSDFSKLNMESEAEGAYKVHFQGQERISPIAMEYFLKTIELAKENGINIVFVKYPMSFEYDKIITSKGVDKKNYYEEVFENVNKTLGKNYEVLDYYSLFFDNSSYFANSNHLNFIGAKKFSATIYGDLNKMNLKNQCSQKQTSETEKLVAFSKKIKQKIPLFSLILLIQLSLLATLFSLLVRRNHNEVN